MTYSICQNSATHMQQWNFWVTNMSKTLQYFFYINTWINCFRLTCKAPHWRSPGWITTCRSKKIPSLANCVPSAGVRHTPGALLRGYFFLLWTKNSHLSRCFVCFFLYSNLLQTFLDLILFLRWFAYTMFISCDLTPIRHKWCYFLLFYRKEE